MPPDKTYVLRAARRDRAARVAAVCLGVGMFGAAALGTVQGGRSAAVDDLDRALQSDAFANVSALEEYFERAESVSLLLAHDSAFASFAPGSAAAPPDARARRTVARQASEAMAYLEELYPGRISEACLIDSTGTEIARVVDGTIAPASELSTEEAQTPFFAPTLALPEGRVYQSSPYLSPDTGKWVISNSTPLVTGPARPWGLVHFEVSLDSFQPEQGRGSQQGRSVSVVDTRTGQIVLRDGDPVIGARVSSTVPPALRPSLTTAVPASRTVQGQRVAVAPLPRQADNANAWAVVVSEPLGGLGEWWRSVGLAPVGMAVAALLLLTIAALSLRASHHDLRRASLTDELTGLPNRRLIVDRLDQALLLARRHGAVCGVLLIDLDRFKEVNDTLGHHYGDELLRAVAGRLGGVFRESDTVSRLGGDEFAVLLPEIQDEGAALALARRCLAALHEQFVVDGVVLGVEASIGLALAPVHGHDGDALLRAADVAMYAAKERRAGVVTYDPDLDVNTPTRLALLGDLRLALQHDELILYYQPKVDCATGSVRGVEALVRWQHPQRGLVPPAEFIPIAEGTGLIVPLTIRTLEIAMDQALVWKHGGSGVQVAVNLSPRCLLEHDFCATVVALLQARGLPAHLLRLEITESTIMADPAKALADLTSLQQAGISLSIDDFGTGYSSMSYLRRLPVDELKIDRSFIADMLSNGSDSVLVRSSIDLGHNLGLSVVAEGVEDQETVRALQALGCDVLQGYHLARPMDAAAMSAWMGSHRSLPVQAATLSAT